LREHVQIAHAAAQDGASGPLSGSSFVFTGKMVAFARSEGEKRVRAKGGSVHSSVTKELTYLVKGADASGPVSSKEKAAQKLIAQGASLRILSEDELLAMLEG
jgi:DNA ligase (NAD+)